MTTKINRIMNRFRLITRAPITQDRIITLSNVGKTIIRVVMYNFLHPCSFGVPMTRTMIRQRLALSYIPFTMRHMVTITNDRYLNRQNSWDVSIIHPSNDSIGSMNGTITVTRTKIISRIGLTSTFQIRQRRLYLIYGSTISAGLCTSPLISNQSTITRLIRASVQWNRLLRRAMT